MSAIVKKFQIWSGLRLSYGSLNKKLLSSGLRPFSTEGGESGVCYLLGLHGIFAFPINNFQPMDEFFRMNPILTPVPPDKLFGSIPSNTFILNDKARLVSRSGTLAAYMANKNDVFFSDLFKKDNVGVLKGTKQVLFKQLGTRKKISASTWEGYRAFSIFMKNMIVEMHGKSMLSTLPSDLRLFFSDMETPKGLDETILIHHPTTLPDLAFGDVCVDAYQLLVKELPVLNQRATAAHILGVVGVANLDCMKTVLGNGLLPQFLPFQYQRQFPVNSFPWPSSCHVPIMTLAEKGAVVVHTPRHGYIHGLEKDSVAAVQRNFPHIPHFTRIEVLSAGSMVFS